MNIELTLSEDQAERLEKMHLDYIAEFFVGSEQCKKDNEIIEIVEAAIQEARDSTKGSDNTSTITIAEAINHAKANR